MKIFQQRFLKNIKSLKTYISSLTLLYKDMIKLIYLYNHDSNSIHFD